MTAPPARAARGAHEGGCLCGGVRYRTRGRRSIAAGTLDEPTGLRTIAEIFTATPGDYYELTGEGARFPRGLSSG